MRHFWLVIAGTLLRAGPTIPLFVSRGSAGKRFDLCPAFAHPSQVLEPGRSASRQRCGPCCIDSREGACLAELLSAVSQYGSQEKICNAFLKLGSCDDIWLGCARLKQARPSPQARSRSKRQHESMGAQVIAAFKNGSLCSLMASKLPLDVPTFAGLLDKLMRRTGVRTEVHTAAPIDPAICVPHDSGRRRRAGDTTFPA